MPEPELIVGAGFIIEKTATIKSPSSKDPYILPRPPPDLLAMHTEVQIKWLGFLCNLSPVWQVYVVNVCKSNIFPHAFGRIFLWWLYIR